jgi:N-acetylglucosaminyldiphosphoundecaprenol N-acetyl-beta-D-mannosaminyltransferase
MSAPTWDGPAIEAFTGCPVTPVDLESLLEEIEAEWARGRWRLLIGSHNINSLSLLRVSEGMRDFYSRCDACYVDGVPVIWLMRWAGLATDGAIRFTLMDALPELCQWLSMRGYRLYYLGGTPESVRRGRKWLQAAHPSLNAKLHHGFFDDEDSVVEEINAFGPHILLVGMGMPRQEEWILRHLERIEAGALLQAGGTLDYYTGQQARPPLWISRSGLGGIYRLARNPRRLWQRYLLAPWRLLAPVIRLRRTLHGRLH